MPRNQWVELWDDLPRDLKRKTIQCAKTIWWDVGKTHVESLDNWWHDVMFSYIPGALSQDPPEAISLYLIEGEADYPRQDVHYVVHILRRQIEVCLSPPELGYVTIPRKCMPTIDELEKWVRDIPERERLLTIRKRANDEERVRRAKEAKQRAGQEDTQPTLNNERRVT